MVGLATGREGTKIALLPPCGIFITRGALLFNHSGWASADFLILFRKSFQPAWLVATTVFFSSYRTLSGTF